MIDFDEYIQQGEPNKREKSVYYTVIPFSMYPLQISVRQSSTTLSRKRPLIIQN